MARGGYRPGAGRPRKGEKRVGANVETQTEAEGTAPVLIENKTPLEFMLTVMNDTSQSEARRDRMAIAAAPYMHQRAGEQGKKEERQEAAKKASTGRFASAAPPKLIVDNTR